MSSWNIAAAPPRTTLHSASPMISSRSTSPAAAGPSATWLQSSAASTNAALPHENAAGIASGLTPSMNRAAHTCSGMRPQRIATAATIAEEGQAQREPGARIGGEDLGAARAGRRPTRPRR